MAKAQPGKKGIATKIGMEIDREIEKKKWCKKINPKSIQADVMLFTGLDLSVL